MSKWKEVALGEACDILDHRRIPLNDEERFHMKGDVPYYGANNVVDHIDRFIFDEPLILLAEDGGNFDEFETRSIAYRIRGKSWVNNHAHVLRARPGYDQDFVFYTIEHKDIRTFIKGGTRTKLNQADLKAIKFKCPNEENTQRTIARILGTLDGLIERTEALIAKQQQIKQGLLQDLFTRGVDAHGRLRPPHSEAPELYHETALGWLPKGWRVDSLSAGLELLTDYEANGSFEHVKLNVMVYDEPNYAWYVRATDLEQKLGLDKVRYVDKASYEFLTKTTLHGGEVTVTKRGEIGKVYRVPYAPLPITLAPNMYLLRLNDRLDPNYLFHYFKSSQGQHELLRNNASTTLGALYKDDVKAMRVPFAPNDEQTEIAWRIDLFERSIENELMQAEKYRAIKSGLMQDLLTGRVSVESIMEVQEPRS